MKTAEMKANLLGYMKTAEIKIMIVNDILPILESWHNKQINKRIVDKIYEICGDKYSVHLENDKFSKYFRLGIRYKNELVTFVLCLKENKKFDLSFCKEENYYLFDNRYNDNLDKYKKALDLIDVWSDRLDKINSEKESLLAEMETYGCKYITQ